MIEEIYKEFSEGSGVYKITNLINNKVYVGSSINIQRRIKEHLKALVNNSHYNCKLQGTYNKYGLNNLKFEVIVNCTREYNVKMEQWYIDVLKPELNLTKYAYTTLGLKYTKEQKAHAKLVKSGIRNPQAKLTNEQVTEIRNSKLRGNKLAKIYNISTSQISMVRNFKSYIL